MVCFFSKKEAGFRASRVVPSPLRVTQQEAPHAGEPGGAPVEKLLIPPPLFVIVTCNRKLQSLPLHPVSQTAVCETWRNGRLPAYRGGVIEVPVCSGSSMRPCATLYRN